MAEYAVVLAVITVAIIATLGLLAGGINSTRAASPQPLGLRGWPAGRGRPATEIRVSRPPKTGKPRQVRGFRVECVPPD